MNRIFGVLSFKEAHGEYQGELLAEPQFNRHQTLKRQDNPESDDNAVDSLTMRKGDQMGINQEKMGNAGVVVHKKKVGLSLDYEIFFPLLQAQNNTGGETKTES